MLLAALFAGGFTWARQGMQVVIFQISHLAADGFSKLFPHRLAAKVLPPMAFRSPCGAGKIHFLSQPPAKTRRAMAHTLQTVCAAHPKAVGNMAAGDITHLFATACSKPVKDTPGRRSQSSSLRGTADKPAGGWSPTSART